MNTQLTWSSFWLWVDCVNVWSDVELSIASLTTDNWDVNAFPVGCVIRPDEEDIRGYGFDIDLWLLWGKEFFTGDGKNWGTTTEGRRGTLEVVFRSSEFCR